MLSSEHGDWVAALEAAGTDLGTWRPKVEAVVNDLKLVVNKMAKHWTVWCMVHDTSSHRPGLMASPTLAVTLSSAWTPTNSSREVGFGSVATVTHIPVKGTSSPSLPYPPRAPKLSSRLPASSLSPAHPASRLPKLQFPKFDGDIHVYEKYAMRSILLSMGLSRFGFGWVKWRARMLTGSHL